MTECEVSSQRLTLLVLVHVSLGLGVVFSTTVLAVFVRNWHTSLSLSYRQKRMPQLMAIIVTLLPIERCLRFIGLTLFFFDDSNRHLIAWLWYHLNNIVLLSSIFGTLFAYLISSFEMTFSGSVFELSTAELRTLYSLALFSIIGLNLFLILNGMRVLKLMDVSPILLSGLNVIAMVSCITLICLVNKGFVSRLESLISSHVACSSEPRILSSSSVPNQSPRLPSEESSMNTTTSMWSTSTINHGADDEKDAKEVRSQSEIKVRQPSLISEIMSSNVELFDSEHTIILKAAAKSSVLCLWISLAILLLGAAGMLFSFGRNLCDNWFVIGGHSLIACSFGMISLSVFFSVSNAGEWYRFCCSECDSLLLKVVAYSTRKQISQIEQQNTNAS